MFLYLIADPGGAVKVGIAECAEQRLRDLQTGNPRKLRLIQAWAHDDARRIEARVHATLRRFRTYGEWFALAAEKVIPIAEASLRGEMVEPLPFGLRAPMRPVLAPTHREEPPALPDLSAFQHRMGYVGPSRVATQEAQTEWLLSCGIAQCDIFVEIDRVSRRYRNAAVRDLWPGDVLVAWSRPVFGSPDAASEFVAQARSRGAEVMFGRNV